jgi:hypothetical protein
MLFIILSDGSNNQDWVRYIVNIELTMQSVPM